MEVDAFVEDVQARRRRIREHVDLVAAAGQTAAANRAAAEPNDTERAVPDRVEAETEEESAIPVAALPPDNDPGVALRVLFQDRASSLSPLAESDLDALATQLQREDELPIQIRAYWSLADGSPTAAKLQALKRGLTVRSYLTEKGLRQVQVELTQVRAEEAPPLVVDVVLARA